MASITKLTNTNSDSNVQYFLYDHGSDIKFGELQKYINQYGYSLIDNETAYTQAVSDLGTSNTIPGEAVLRDGSYNIFYGGSGSSPGSLPSTGTSTTRTYDASYALVVQYDQDYYKLMDRKYVLLNYGKYKVPKH